jgi:hypothetical protein
MNKVRRRRNRESWPRRFCLVSPLPALPFPALLIHKPLCFPASAVQSFRDYPLEAGMKTEIEMLFYGRIASIQPAGRKTRAAENDSRGAREVRDMAHEASRRWPVYFLRNKPVESKPRLCGDKTLLRRINDIRSLSCPVNFARLRKLRTRGTHQCHISRDYNSTAIESRCQPKLIPAVRLNRSKQRLFKRRNHLLLPKTSLVRFIALFTSRAP